MEKYINTNSFDAGRMHFCIPKEFCRRSISNCVGCEIARIIKRGSGCSLLGYLSTFVTDPVVDLSCDMVTTPLCNFLFDYLAYVALTDLQKAHTSFLVSDSKGFLKKTSLKQQSSS